MTNSCFLCDKTLEGGRARPPLVATLGQMEPGLVAEVIKEIGPPPYHVCTCCIEEIPEDLGEKDLQMVLAAAKFLQRNASAHKGIGEE